MREKIIQGAFLFVFLSLCQSLVFSQDKGSKPKNDFKTSYFITGDIMHANMETYATFNRDGGLISAKVSLEDNLGLEKSKFFFNGAGIMRITYRSGLFASYYRIHRKKEYTVKRDIPYLNELIPQGTEIDTYFNTNVLSLGYLFTAVSDSKSFLGLYFNVFLMSLKTGVESQGTVLNEDMSYVAPLPNFGFIASFDLAKKLSLNGRFGMFVLRVDEFKGKIGDANVSINYQFIKWLGVRVAYKVFDLEVVSVYKKVETTVEYNFRGPALG